MIKRLHLIILSLLLATSVLFTAKAMIPNRHVLAEFHKPFMRFWSSEWRARGRASAAHGRLGGNIMPHRHGGDWVSYAEIYGLEPDRDSGQILWLIWGKNQNKLLTGGGESEVNGDADDASDGWAWARLSLTGVGKNNVRRCTICGFSSW